MSQPAGKCVFCGGGGLTKSHIWPEWLSKIYPHLATQHEQITGEVHTFEPKMKRPPYRRIVRPGHAGTRKPRNTCKACNHGWMRAVEERAIEPTTWLVQETPSWLDAKGRRAVAALFCLIAIRVEFTDPSTQATSADDRAWLKERLEPPPLWQIWIARYTGSNPDFHFLRHFGIQLVSSPDERITPGICDTQTTTLVVGKLCVHAFSSSTFPEFAGYRDGDLCRLWPLMGWDIDSRFLPTINDREVIWLSESIPRNLPPVPDSTA